MGYTSLMVLSGGNSNKAHHGRYWCVMVSSGRNMYQGVSCCGDTLVICCVH